MKKFIAASILAIAFLSTPALAADKIITGSVSGLTQKADKNGKQYMRAFIKEERELSGIKYTVDVPVVAFSNLEQFRQDAADGNIKAIVKEQSYNGGTSYLYRASIQ